MSHYDEYEKEYQLWITKNLPRILDKIEDAYYSEYNKISSLTFFSFNAKKMTHYNLVNHIVGKIVNFEIQDSQIFELEHIALKENEEIHNKVFKIYMKYRYFGERLSCNLDIGNKIKEIVYNNRGIL